METDSNSETSPSQIESLAETDLVATFERLKAFYNLFNGLRNDMSQLQGQLSDLLHQSANNLITKDEETLRTNQVRHGVLFALENFKSTLPEFMDTPQQSTINRGVNDQVVLVREVMSQRLRQHYEVKEALKDGNSSLIFLLEDIFTGRNAVAKVFKLPTLTPDIKTEIQLISRLKHRNIIKILDESLATFPFYVITEYVNGTILTEAVDKTGPRPPSQVVDWLDELSGALDYLRLKGIAHSNVRPSKIFIDEEQQPMISPFDVIKFGSSEHSVSRFKEDSLYLSPEQLAIDGQEMNSDSLRLSDQFSLGLVGYKMLTGEDLFFGNSIQEIIHFRDRFFKDEHLQREKLNRIRMKDMRKLVARMIQFKPEDRYPDLHEVMIDLRKINVVTRETSEPVRASYRRCMGTNREFINTFYENFKRKWPEARRHFKNTGKQNVMFQMAVDVLIDLDNKEKYLAQILGAGSVHAPYQTELFEQFLETLIETAHTHDRKWDESIEAEWRKMKAHALQVIKKMREEGGTAPVA